MDSAQSVETAVPSGRTPQAVLDNLMSVDTAVGKASVPMERENYRINIPTFAGPLDLLLHLIKREQIDIYDIPITEICESYLEQLQIMKEFDVNIAGEFMVMAAQLIYIKSVSLLPKEEPEDDEDPRLPLVQQLLEYERFKQVAENLQEQPWMYRDKFPRPSTAIQQMIPKETLKNAPVEPIDTFALLVGLKTSLDRTQRKPHVVTAPPLSLKATVSNMGNALDTSDQVTFAEMLPPKREKRAIIMTFLTILELAKLRFVEIIQHKNFGPIQIRKKKTFNLDSINFLDTY